MITAGQRSGQKHLASLLGPSRLTTRMKRIGSSSWSSCMSMHGERGKKSKTMTPWGPLGTSWNFVKGKWSNREVFLFHSWLKISDLNLKGCLRRRNTEVQDQCHCPVCCTDKFCSQTPHANKTGKKKSAVCWSQAFYMNHWYFDQSTWDSLRPWEDLLDTLWILKCLAAVHWLVHQTTWVMWKLIINQYAPIHSYAIGLTKTDKLHSMKFSVYCILVSRQWIAMKRSPMFMTPAPCWFPMTLMTLSLWHQMMMMASTKKSRKKKTIKVQMLRRPNQCRLPETSSVVVETGSEIQQRPRQELQEQKDPVDEKFKDACCRDLSYFSALSELPRWGLVAKFKLCLFSD